MIQIQSINDYLDDIIQEIVNTPSEVQNEFFSDKEMYNASTMLNAHIEGAATRQYEIIDILMKRKNLQVKNE